MPPHAPHHLTLAAADGASAHAQRTWFDRLAEHWPEHAPTPVLRRLELGDLLNESHERSSVPGVAPGPALIVLGHDDSSATLYKLVDRLNSTFTPAVILAPEAGPGVRRLAGGGLVIDDWAATARDVALVLYTLAERQPTVAALARDLGVAARCNGGVQDEMQRIHDELRLAALVQRELLPKGFPRVRGLDFGVLFRPAGYVSGDLYDVVQIDERRVAFFLADAVGHGVPAALLTMIISRSLRMAPGSGEVPDPAEALTRLNADLVRLNGASPRFATAIHGVIDADSRRVTLSSAGHPPPLRIRRGEAFKIEDGGPLLGVFPDEKFHQTTFDMDEGETLLLYSDGFETAFPTPDQIGARGRMRTSDRYLEHLLRLGDPGHAPTGALSRALEDLAGTLDQQLGSLHQLDDVTAVAVASRPGVWAEIEPPAVATAA